MYNLNYTGKIKDSLVSFTISDDQFLEMALLRIRGETIKFASFQKRKKAEQENRLVKKVANLESKLGHDSLVIMEEKKVKL